MPRAKATEPEDSTANLLRQLSTMDSCEAVSLTDGDHLAGAPNWAELALTIERDGKGLLHYLRRHDAELIVEVLFRVLHPNAGKSIHKQLWADLDACMVNLMDGGLDVMDKREFKGKALGLATALALVENPYGPDVGMIRKQASERYEATH